jgi:hypothetical protein
MLVSGHNYKIANFNTNDIHEKYIYTKKPLLKSKAESFVTREANSLIFLETDLLLVQTICTNLLIPEWNDHF